MGTSRGVSIQAYAPPPLHIFVTIQNLKEKQEHYPILTPKIKCFLRKYILLL
jgi:hypothetical protein